MKGNTSWNKVKKIAQAQKYDPILHWWQKSDQIIAFTNNGIPLQALHCKAVTIKQIIPSPFYFIDMSTMSMQWWRRW